MQQSKKGVKRVLLKLRGKRVEAGYTQEELAKLIGVSIATYRLKECGDREFTMSEINSILKLLGCNYEDIFLQ